MSLRRTAFLALLCAFVMSGCYVRARYVTVTPLDAATAPNAITAPVKAHLRDGSVLVFRGGVSVTDTELLGAGTRFTFQLDSVGPVTRVPLDSVIAFESFNERTNVAGTVLLSLLGTAAGVLGAAGLLVAAFGSCPTIYADSAGTQVLQAESFSYSIAPLFEMRDVDPVRVRPDSTGAVWLEVRNEALETHYLNHFELLAVEHDPDELLLADERGRPVLVRTAVAPTRARDSARRDVLAVIAAHDSLWFASDDALVQAPEAAGYRDHIELFFDDVAEGDSAAIVIRLRNSLLNTVLFYDVMLGAAGAQAVNWLGHDLEEIGAASEMGRWYSVTTGIRVSVWNGSSYQEHARIPDVGPIAHKDVAVVIPTSARSVRVRLDFLADSWRIDRIALAPAVRRGTPRSFPVASVRAGEVSDAAAAERLRNADDTYIATRPGESFRIRFDAGASSSGTTSFLLAAQGYYTEWVRSDWVRSAPTGTPFKPGDAALHDTFARWRIVRADFEQQFFAHRVPLMTP